MRKQGNRSGERAAPFHDALHHAVLGLLALRMPDARREHKELKRVISDDELEKATQDILRWQEAGIYSVGISDREYPPQLKQIHNPPTILFYRGTHPKRCSLESSVSIVGSRRAEPYSCQLAHDIASELTSRGVCIVSGLALGVDGAAHRGTLVPTEVRFPTICVLGNGLHRVYPSAHERLAQQILSSGGTLLSQFEPEERPYPSNFLNRNRIISGLSLAIVVIEAGERSGSLVTARYALEQGREVFTVPGSTSGRRNHGSNGLLRQGATPIRNVEDLLEDLPQLEVLEQGLEPQQSTELSPQARLILSRICQDGECAIRDLQQIFPEVSDLPSSLLELELEGLLVHVPGQRVVSTALAQKYY